MNNSQLIEAIDRLQTQTRPLLSESVYKKSNVHTLMLTSSAEINGAIVSFVAVKGVKTWAMFYLFGQKSASHIAENGIKATPTQVERWIDVEGDLMEFYRS